MAKKKTSEDKQRTREIFGVCLSAIGLFLGVSIYSDSAGTLGESIGGFIFGLWGIFCYAIPVIIVICGIAIIAKSSGRIPVGKYSIIICMLILTESIVQIAYDNSVEKLSFFQYVLNAFNVSSISRTGGGLFGALLPYPMLGLLGTAGSYIFLGAALIVFTIILTQRSIKNTTELVSGKIKNGLEASSARRNERKKIYNEKLTDDLEEDKKSKKVKRTIEGVDFLPSEGPIAKSSLPVQKDSMDFDFEPPVDDDLEEDIEEPYQMPVTSKIKPFDRASVKSDPSVEFSHPSQIKKYQLPSAVLLDRVKTPQRTTESVAARSEVLVSTLKSFGIDAKITDVCVGPVITRFELQPAPGVRVNRITNLSDDIALALAAPRVRIEAPIPGKAAIGIEVPNRSAATVLFSEIVQSKEFAEKSSKITLVLGKDIAGKTAVTDLAKMPHLLIAGATGSGKSVCINNIIISILYKATPSEVRLILIDPKVVELSGFSGIPHLGLPVVTDAKKAAVALQGAVNDMETRYKEFAKAGVRDLARYNDAAIKKGDPIIPQTVIIIDELADLMMVASVDVETAICRIAQMGRAAGIHLIVATQRPSTDVITGLIKANIPSRIAFAVSSQTDSRIILDTGGAEKLLGRGDMLFHPNGADKPMRVQGAYVSDKEIESVVRFWQAQSENGEDAADSFSENYSHFIENHTAGESGSMNAQFEDELLPTAVEIVLDSGQASISLLQRRLRIGYARAARLIDIMEQHNIVSGFEGSKPRRVLIKHGDLADLFPELDSERSND